MTTNVLAPHNLPYQMRLLVQLLTRRFQELIEPYDLTPLHWGILSCLWQQNGATTQQIVENLEQLGGTVTVGLDVMQRRKFITRRADKYDRRISRVWLTKKGATLQPLLVPQVEQFVKQVFACFSQQETAELSRLLTRLRHHVEAAFDEDMVPQRTGRR